MRLKYPYTDRNHRRRSIQLKYFETMTIGIGGVARTTPSPEAHNHVLIGAKSAARSIARARVNFPQQLDPQVSGLPWSGNLSPRSRMFNTCGLLDIVSKGFAL